MAFVQKGVCTNDFQKVLQNLMELDDEWTIEEFAQHAYSLGYDLFVLGWSDRLKGPCTVSNIGYMHCFKLKHSVNRLLLDPSDGCVRNRG